MDDSTNDRWHRPGRAFRPDELAAGCMVAVTGLTDINHGCIRELGTGLEITNVVAFRLEGDTRVDKGRYKIKLTLGPDDTEVEGIAATLGATAEIAEAIAAE